MHPKLLNALCLASGIFFVPGVIFGASLFTDQDPGELLTSTSIFIIYYIPLLAITSVFRPHFSCRLAAVPLVGILLLEALSVLPGYAPFDLLGRAFSPLSPHADLNVLGKSVFLLIGAGFGILSLLHKITIFRLVASVMALAQCVVVAAFHILVVVWPFEGMELAERQLVQSVIERDGDMSRLCDVDGRKCARGEADLINDWASSMARHPDQVSALLRDTDQHPRLFHLWVEKPSPEALEKVGILSVLKHDIDDLEIMLSADGPTTLYANLRLSLGLLIAAFHATWIALGLLILARHGKYQFKQGRWRRAS